MTDWILIWDQLLFWVQWITTFTLIALIGFAGLCYILRNRKWAVDCAIIAVVLLITAMILAQYGIEILSPEVYEFFQKIFNF